MLRLLKVTQISLVLALTTTSALAENMVFPSGAVVSVKSFGAVGNGTTDDTAAINQALADSGGKIIYFPNGTYLVSDTISRGTNFKRIFLQGQSRSGAIIKLKNDCAGFGGSSTPKPVISFREDTASTGQAFRNSMYNLTVDIGSGNPNAIGVRFINNNQGGMRDVTIKSSDVGKAGHVGLDLTRPWPGPAYFKNVTISGFSYGIKSDHYTYSNVFENITLNDQISYAIYNNLNILTFRGLTVSGPARAIHNHSSSGMVVVLEGTFTRTGSATAIPAVYNAGELFLRDCTFTNYSTPVNGQSLTSPVTEYLSDSYKSLFTPVTNQSMRLAIENTPEVTWDTDMTIWRSVTADGANGADTTDDTAAIQAALNSGKANIYFPPGNYRISSTLTVSGAVKRIFGSECTLTINSPLKDSTNALFKIQSNTPDTVIIERFEVGYGGGTFTFAEQATAKSLVMRNLLISSGKAYRNTVSGNKLYIEDVTGAPWAFSKGQKVWARQLNPEAKDATSMVNEGSVLWVLGLKSEYDEVVLETKKNSSGIAGQSEIFGGLQYGNGALDATPMFIDDSSITFYVTQAGYTTVMKEIRNGTTKTMLNSSLPGPGDRKFLFYTGWYGQ